MLQVKLRDDFLFTYEILQPNYVLFSPSVCSSMIFKAFFYFFNKVLRGRSMLDHDKTPKMDIPA